MKVDTVVNHPKHEEFRLTVIEVGPELCQCRRHHDGKVVPMPTKTLETWPVVTDPSQMALLEVGA